MWTCLPGTGDVALTVFQSLPLDGIVIVTSPQELVSMIVEKAVKMAQLMNVPVIGIVENMSFFTCPDCGKNHKIFGDGHVNEVAAKYEIGTISEIPINQKIAAACDKGMIELLTATGLTTWLRLVLPRTIRTSTTECHRHREGCTHDCGSCGVDGCGSGQ